MNKVVSVAALAFVFSCSAKKTEPAATGSGSGSGSAAAPAKEEPPAKGLHNKENDPTLVKLAEEAVKCKADGNRLEWNCDGYKAWRDTHDPYNDSKADKTLSNFLEDADEKVRFLAADQLRDHEPKDVTLIKRDLAAAQAETSALVGEWMGRALGRMDVTSAGVAADAVKLITDSKSPELRYGLITGGAENPAFSDAILKVGNEGTDVKLRLAAVNAFYNNTPEGKEADVCKMWFANVDSADSETAGAAASIDGRISACKDNWDALMDKIEAKVKASDFKSYDMVGALNWIHDGSTATDPQKKRTIDIAKLVANDEKNGESARARAIEFLAPNETKFVQKFLKDKDDYVRQDTERTLKK